jgi:hypothetical protein
MSDDARRGENPTERGGREEGRQAAERSVQ